MERDQKGLPLINAINFIEKNNLKELSEKIKVITASTPNKRERRRILKPLLVVEMENHEILDTFIEEYWQYAKTADGKKILQMYKNRYTADVDANDEDDELDETNEFAYEEDLKNYLVSNLSLIENGLKLFVDKDGTEGVEYAVDEKQKRIDILAVDKLNNYVIIELKVSKGYEKVVGQCLYYKNKLREKLSVENVRVVIIARKHDERLKIAIKDLKDFELFEYTVSVKLNKV